MARRGAMSTLLLTRQDIAALMRPADYYEAVDAAFRAAKHRRAASPPPMHIDGLGGAFHAKGAFLAGDRACVALKLNGNFPDNPKRGLPTIQGAILLCDASDGTLLAILDSIEITLQRTAAASAIAANHLAREDARILFIAGCGEQARAHVRALRETRPFEKAFAYDIDAGKARAFAADMQRSCGLPFESAGLSEARGSDVLVLCTTATRAYLDCEHVAQGAFIAAVGADSPSKSEVAPALMANAAVVTDVTEQCVKMGDLRTALAANAVTIADVHADLGEILTGQRPGRTRREEIFIFDSTGTALQDVASAALVYERALDRGVGLDIPLGDA